VHGGAVEGAFRLCLGQGMTVYACDLALTVQTNMASQVSAQNQIPWRYKMHLVAMLWAKIKTMKYFI